MSGFGAANETGKTNSETFGEEWLNEFYSDSSIDERDPTSESPHNRERKPGHGRRENETSFDSSFTTPGVVYFASSGDQPGVQYPAASPNVVAAGGTTTARNPFTANFLSERAWDLTGRGLSAFEARSAELV